MNYPFLGRVHLQTLLVAAVLAPLSLAWAQTPAGGNGGGSDDLAKRLEWLRAQVGTGADSKATPNPGAKKHFSDSRALGLRPGEARSPEVESAQKSIAESSATTPSPSKTQPMEAAAKKARVAENAASPAPATASKKSKAASAEAPAKVAKASPSPSPTQKSVAQASTLALEPIAEGPKKRKGRKVAKTEPEATPAPSTPEPRVAAKPSPTPAARNGNLSLDTRFADVRMSDSRSAQSSKSPANAPSMPIVMNSGSGSVSGRYPWKSNIVTTVFWIGEPVGGNNFTPNVSSSWDSNWTRNYGGYDNPKPEARRNYIPANFIPRQNPFYVALPYNDVTRGTTKPEARVVIPWFREAFRREGQSVCRDRWVAVRNRAGRVAYAQWSDCGPFRTDHWQYVFGMERPRPNLNQGAGLDVSPAMRDYLGLQSTDVTDWKFVEARDVPYGPWAIYGDNNTFVQRGRFTRSAKADLPTMPELVSRTR